MTLTVYPAPHSFSIWLNLDGSLTIGTVPAVVLTPEDTEALREYLNKNK